MTVRVRRLQAGEAALLRELRLRALADAPLAFGATHGREAGASAQRWEDWAREAADGRRQVLFVAVGPAGEPAGLASGVIDAGDARRAHLYAMWVAPEARRTGAAAALVEAVAAWAGERGAATLATGVTAGNDAAAALYARTGFRDTGVREALGHSGAEVARLERNLAPG